MWSGCGEAARSSGTEDLRCVAIDYWAINSQSLYICKNASFEDDRKDILEHGRGRCSSFAETRLRAVQGSTLESAIRRLPNTHHRTQPPRRQPPWTNSSNVRPTLENKGLISLRIVGPVVHNRVPEKQRLFQVAVLQYMPSLPAKLRKQNDPRPLYFRSPRSNLYLSKFPGVELLCVMLNCGKVFGTLDLVSGCWGLPTVPHN